MTAPHLDPVGVADPRDLYADGIAPDGVVLDVPDEPDDITGRDSSPRPEDGPQDVEQTPEPATTGTEA
jgi:hypothetical protein